MCLSPAAEWARPSASASVPPLFLIVVLLSLTWHSRFDSLTERGEREKEREAGFQVCESRAHDFCDLCCCWPRPSVRSFCIVNALLALYPFPLRSI